MHDLRRPCCWMFVLLPLANRFVRMALKDASRLPDEMVSEFVRLARHPRGVLGYARYNQAALGPWGMRNDLSGRVREIGTGRP